MQEQRESNGPQLLGDCLRQVITSRIGRRQWEFYELVCQWRQLVGSRVADHTEPAWIGRDVLWVFVDGPAWMQELSLMKQELLARIRRSALLDTIRDIRWLQRPLARTREQTRQPHPERSIDPDQIREFSRLSEIVRDSDCQQALFRLWQTVKRRQREQ